MSVFNPFTVSFILFFFLLFFPTMLLWGIAFISNSGNPLQFKIMGIIFTLKYYPVKIISSSVATVKRSFSLYVSLKEWWARNFPGGWLVRNLPSKAEYVGLISVRGTEIPYAAGQLSLPAATREAHVPQWRPRATKIKKKKKNGSILNAVVKASLPTDVVDATCYPVNISSSFLLEKWYDFV